MSEAKEVPVVTLHNLLSMQVCVPTTYTDEQVVAFAEREYPCGTRNGWFVRKEGDEKLASHKERVECDMREGYVHIMLDA